MNSSRKSMQFVKLYMLLLILISGIGLWLYPRQYAASSAYYYADYDNRRADIHRDLVKSKTSREMDFRVKNSLQSVQAGNLTMYEKKQIQRRNVDFSRERGSLIVKERASRGLSSDGTVTPESSMNVAQRRASAISKWSIENIEKKAN